MSLNLENLEDGGIRKLMLNEVEEDIKNGKIYLSLRLKKECEEIYVGLLKKSIQDGNDDSLAQDILDKNCLRTMMLRKKPSGGNNYGASSSKCTFDFS